MTQIYGHNSIVYIQFALAACVIGDFFSTPAAAWYINLVLKHQSGCMVCKNATFVRFLGHKLWPQRAAVGHDG